MGLVVYDHFYWFIGPRTEYVQVFPSEGMSYIDSASDYSFSYIIQCLEFAISIATSHSTFYYLEKESTADTAVDRTTSNNAELLTSPPAFFGHLTDEMLSFEACLDGLCYPTQAERPIDILTRRLDVLKHWITLESALAHAKLMDMLAKPYAWRVENR